MNPSSYPFPVSNLPRFRVYCKYHYLEGHEFKTPEDELRHFLTKLGDPNWYWADQYLVDPDDNEFDATRKSMCHLYLPTVVIL